MNSAVSSDLSAGSVFAGRYRVERRIAAGGMGEVYEVVHIETNRRRALKVMHAQYVSNDELRGKFRQEARVAAEIESDHIVDVFDAGIDEATGMPFLVMEFLRGEDLRTRLKRVGALPKAEALQYLYETSLALDKTHRARIVHRDLKPDNLFLCDRAHGPPVVKVLDFGIAKIVSEFSAQANATSSLGTPLYMSPEQFVMKGMISPATDIFALGLITFTLLVGKPYWYEESISGGGLVAFALHVASGPQASPVARAWQFGVELPPGFDAWFFRATAREPAARFASAGEAVSALADVLGLPVPAQRVSAHRATLPSVNVLEPPAPVQSTANTPAPTGTSPTGPTQLAMFQASSRHEPMSGQHGPRSMKLVVLATAATMVIGLGILLVVKGFSGASSDEPSQTPVKKQAAALSTSSSGPTPQLIQPVENPPVVLPVTSSSAVASSSEHTPSSNASNELSAPVPGNSVTKPATKTAPAVTAKTPAVKPGTRGTWEAD